MCNVHIGTILDPAGEPFAGGLCDDCADKEAGIAADALIEKVRERLAACNDRTSDKETIKAACWFVAYHEADAFLDSWKTKDVASLIEDGTPIGGPFKTRDHIKEWCLTVDDWDWLDSALNTHFGITK